MALTNQQKGKLFEHIIKRILLANGFTEVPSDNVLVFNGSAGQMVHGLGQAHNTDILLEPPFQIPFFYPSRLIVECKCYDTSLGLPIIRGVLGLREDINRFEIVTPQILSTRRNNHRAGPAAYPMKRYVYQTAVASLNGFKLTAQEFALVHHIPLIDFGDTLFAHALKDILDWGEIDLEDEQIAEFISGTTPPVYFGHRKFQSKLYQLERNICVAILDSGDIVCLYIENGNKEWIFQATKIEVHFMDNYMWYISPVGNENKKQRAYFNLPRAIFERWAEHDYDRQDAVDLKAHLFRNVYLMTKLDAAPRLNVAKIDQNFLFNLWAEYGKHQEF